MSLLRRLENEARGDSDQGSLNGTSSVELVAAPASGFVRRVRCIRIVNVDTAAVTVALRITVAGPTNYQIDGVIGLTVGGTFLPVEGSDELLLNTDQSLTAVMDAAAATTDPTWYAAWVDVPIPVS